MPRQQLPPQIKKLEITDRKAGKTVVRYQLTLDAGENPLTGKRQQVRRRYATEKQARDALSEIGQAAATDMFVPRKAVTSINSARIGLRRCTTHGLRRSTAIPICSPRCVSSTATWRCRSSPAQIWTSC